MAAVEHFVLVFAMYKFLYRYQIYYFIFGPKPCRPIGARRIECVEGCVDQARILAFAAGLSQREKFLGDRPPCSRLAC